MVPSGLYRSTATKGENMSMGYVGDDGHARAREALKHFVRDWSETGGETVPRRLGRCSTR